MLTVVAFLALVAIGVFILVRGRRATPQAGAVRSIGDLYTFAKSGTVLDVQRRSETTIRSTTTGGSTLLADGVGTVSAPTTSISSSTMEVIRIFLRDDSGTEFDVEVENLNIGVRTGHAVTVLYAGDRTSQQGHAMAIANHTTNQSAVMPHRVEWLIRRRSATLGCLALAIVPFFSMLIGGVALTIVLGPDERGHTGGAVLIGALAFGVIGFTLMLGRSQNERLKADIIAALQRQIALH